MIEQLGLNGLSFYRYRFEMVLDRPLVVAAPNRSVLWRGAFGQVFRSLVCHDIALDCQRCPLLTACPFPRVFAPRLPADRPAIRRLRDPPRPFVFVDPCPGSASLSASRPIGLELVVVGNAVTELPYFVVALRRLGIEGIGRARVTFEVERVHALGATGEPIDCIFQRGSDLVRPIRRALGARDVVRPGDAEARRVRVHFLTPTDLRGVVADVAEGSTIAGPSFGLLVRRARDRLSALATFFGTGPLEHDAKGLGELADRTSLVEAHVSRTSIARRSTRTGERHAIGGWVGSALYEGPTVAAAMPWLRLAEALGVGKHATFGNGRIAVEVI